MPQARQKAITRDTATRRVSGSAITITTTGPAGIPRFFFASWMIHAAMNLPIRESTFMFPAASRR